MSVRHNLLLMDRHTIAEGRIEHNNISRDPRLAISRPDHENLYNIVWSRGKVIEQISQRVYNHIDKLAKKYLRLNKYPYHTRWKMGYSKNKPEIAQLIMYQIA